MQTDRDSIIGVIVSHPKDFEILNDTIKSLRVHASQIEKFVVISPQCPRGLVDSCITWFDEAHFPFRSASHKYSLIQTTITLSTTFIPDLRNMGQQYQQHITTILDARISRAAYLHLVGFCNSF